MYLADWGSMGRVVTQTRGRAFQTLGRAFDFLLRLQKLRRVLESSAERLKGSTVCFKTSTRPSVSLKRVYENLVCKKHCILTGVLCD